MGPTLKVCKGNELFPKNMVDRRPSLALTITMKSNSVEV
jgi:hypothetical protein